MAVPQHVYEIYIKAHPDQVWRAITDPDHTRRYFNSTALEASLEAGSGYRYLLPDGDPAAEGILEVVEPGRRLILTWRTLSDTELAEEPPSRVEWLLEPANDEASVTRVRLRHHDLALSPATWARMGDDWVVVLGGLKTLVETGEELGPIDTAPKSSAEETEREWHRRQAVNANNETWELLDGRELDDDAAFDLLGRAYAAAHHWRAATDPMSINSARAAWLCSRAHAVLGDGAAALRLADRCMAITAVSQDAVDFDRVYATESRARALACLGRTDEARHLRRAAIEAAAEVADVEDRQIVDGDLATGPWYGAGDQDGTIPQID